MEHAAVISSGETRLGWGWLFFQLLVLPGLLTFGAQLLPWPVSLAQINFVFYALNLLAVCLIFSPFLSASLTHGLENGRRLLLSAALALAAYYGGTWALSRLIQFFQPDFFNVNDQTVARMGQEDWLLTAVGAALLVPTAEECFYRGLIFRRLYPKNRWYAYGLSAAVFSAVHVTAYLGKYPLSQLALCFLQYLPAGLCLAWAYALSGTILAPILIHALINAWSAISLLL